jgi:hypothetical protein
MKWKHAFSCCNSEHYDWIAKIFDALDIKGELKQHVSPKSPTFPEKRGQSGASD